MPEPRRAMFGRGGARAGRARPTRAVIALAAIIVAAAAAVSLLNVGPPAPSTATRGIESIFEDDALLLDQPVDGAGDAEVQRTLMTLRSLGVDRIRLVILWVAIAPSQRPAGFDAADPAAYPPGAWGPFDRIDRLARADGIAVYFDLSDPGPLWAMTPGGGSEYGDHYAPSAADFGEFTEAVGRRYDGTYSAPAGPGAAMAGPLPRVSFWSFWNEPNQPGWLAPQYTTTSDGTLVPESPRLYRSYLDAGYQALVATGHTPATDTILIGELAPEGGGIGAEAPITPMPFLRALYCVDDGYRILRGAGAAMLGCPEGGQAATFVAEHPALFDASGFAHHPYSLIRPPDASLPDPNDVPLSDLDRLEHGLDRIFGAYGVDRTLPIYLTEYGYETDPPRPATVVPPGVGERDQSLYLNEAQYLASKDPRVRAMAQFELRDSLPDTQYAPGSPEYWQTFQTGLEFADGRRKAAFAAYRLPIYLPETTAPAGGSVLVWGMLRSAPNDTRQTARIQWRPPEGRYRTIATVTTNDPSGYVTARVRLPGPGAIRIAWTSKSGMTISSRGVGVDLPRS